MIPMIALRCPTQIGVYKFWLEFSTPRKIKRVLHLFRIGELT
jgi:hypothetical protein